MKKKVLCVMLSLTLCSSMVLQVGAAALTDQQPEAGDEQLTDGTDEGDGTDLEDDGDGAEDPDSEEPSEELEPQDPEDEEKQPDDLNNEKDEFEEGTEDTNKNTAVPGEVASVRTEGLVHKHLIETQGIVSADQVEWVQDENGDYKLYCNAEGCDSLYFTADDGMIGVQDGENVSYYYFDEEGCMVTGAAEIKASETGLPKADGIYYFLGAGENNTDGVVGKSMVMALNDVSPANSSLGSGQENVWVWTEDAQGGKHWYYYGENGRQTLDELKAAQGGNSLFNIGGKYYALEGDCVPQTGRFAVANPHNGKQSYFYGSETADEEGHVGYLMKGWMYLPTKVASGATASRYQYFGLSKGGAELKKQLGGSDKYYYDGAEYMWNQTMYELRQIESCVNAPDRDMGDDAWYFLTVNGYVEHDKLVVGTFNRPGKYYGVDSKGHLYRSTLGKVKNSSGQWKEYCFSSSGVRANYRNGWYMIPDTKDWYYFGSDYAKVLKTGWQSIDLKSDPDRVCWAYYWKSGSGKGKMKKSAWQGSRYLKSNGVMAQGVLNVEGTLYYFKPATKTKCYGTMMKGGWIKGGKWKYYAYSSGKLYRGWHTINGKNYYFNTEKGIMMTYKSRQYTGWKSDLKGKWGYADGTGVWQTGWIKTYLGEKEGDGFRYIDPANGKFVKNEWKTIDGMNFHFKADGWLKLDVSDEIKGPYSVKVNRTTCVMTIYNQSGTTPVKAIRVSVGKAGTPTPKGSYYLSRAGRWQLLMGPSYGQYASHVVGAGQGGIFIHSVAGSAPNSYSLPAAEFDLLGQPASHGCIRTNVRDALWVWTNCNGASIYIGDNLKDPFGKPGWIWIPGSQNYDPTDPAV